VHEQPPRFEFYDPQTPIYTSPRFLPPAKVVKSKINDAIISHGSYLEECTVSNAIIGLRSRVDKGAVIQASQPPLPGHECLCRCMTERSRRLVQRRVRQSTRCEMHWPLRAGFMLMLTAAHARECCRML
jgi:hypothetical protein